jgi:hypothetical protein
MLRTAILLILVAVAICTSCSPRTQPKEAQARQKKESFRQQILQMSAKHSADLNWLTILDRREFFTLELQQALLEPPGQSHLLLAPVVDVLKREDVCVLPSSIENGESQVHLPTRAGGPMVA